MADWHGSARTNYFRVKDEAAFRKWAESIGNLEVTTDDAGRMALLSAEENGGWPWTRCGWWPRLEVGRTACRMTTMTTEECSELPKPLEELADLLQEGAVAIFMEVGAEKLRYLTGHALAVNARKQFRQISLGQIYDLAQALGDEVTVAEK